MSEHEDEDPELHAQLLKHYLSSADEKLARVEAACSTLRAAPQSQAFVEQAYLMLHTLAGNAGTYGFPDLSSRALALSRQLRNDKLATPELLADLVKFRDELKTAFEDARKKVASTT